MVNLTLIDSKQSSKGKCMLVLCSENDDICYVDVSSPVGHIVVKALGIDEEFCQIDKFFWKEIELPGYEVRRTTSNDPATGILREKCELLPTEDK